MARYRMKVVNPAAVVNPEILSLFQATPPSAAQPNGMPAQFAGPQVGQVVWFIEYDGVSHYLPPAGCVIEPDTGGTPLGGIAPQ